MLLTQKFFYDVLFLNIIIFVLFVSTADAMDPPADLKNAIEQGNLTKVQNMLKSMKGIDINAKLDEYNDTLLHLAAGKSGHYKNAPGICRILVEKGADIDALDIDAFSPLSTAVFYGNYPVAESLLSAGANPNLGSPIFIAAQKDRIDFLSLLVKAGANVKGKDGERALRETAGKGHVQFLKELLRERVDVNAAGPLGNTALHFWSDESTFNIEVLHLLISSGANVNAQNNTGYTPLMLAIIPHKDIPENIRVEVMKTFITAGADLSLKNKWNDSAMDLGVKSKYPDVKTFFTSLAAQAGKK